MKKNAPGGVLSKIGAYCLGYEAFFFVSKN